MAVTRVHILADIYTPDLWMPVWFARPWLREREIQVRFFYRPTHPRLFDCDALLIHDLVPLRPLKRRTNMPFAVDAEGAVEFLQREPAASARILWIDRYDGMHTTFDVMPYVTRYLKNQLHTDLDRHRHPRGTGARYVDELWQTMGKAGTPPDHPCPPLLPEHEHKLDLSWNLASYTGFYSPNYKLLPWLKRLKIPKHLVDGSCAFFVRDMLKVNTELRRGRVHQQRFVDPAEARRWKMVGLFGTKRDHDRMWQRRRANEIFAELADPDILAGRYVKPWDYLRATGETKLVLSCFGAGESCYREFEGMIGGAAVLMPDMSHLRTWPDVYRAGETYHPLKWDLSDLVETMEGYLADDDRRLALARGGYAAMRHLWSEAGMSDFADHFSRLINDGLAAPLR